MALVMLLPLVASTTSCGCDVVQVSLSGAAASQFSALAGSYQRQDGSMTNGKPTYQMIDDVVSRPGLRTQSARTRGSTHPQRLGAHSLALAS